MCSTDSCSIERLAAQGELSRGGDFQGLVQPPIGQLQLTACKRACKHVVVYDLLVSAEGADAHYGMHAVGCHTAGCMGDMSADQSCACSALPCVLLAIASFVAGSGTCPWGQAQ